MTAATGNNIAEHIMRLAMVIPASMVTVSCGPFLIWIVRLRGYLMKMHEWWMRRQMGKRLTVVLM
jgi:hypothetical protein